jgi:hypothetical protein
MDEYAALLELCRTSPQGRYTFKRVQDAYKERQITREQYTELCTKLGKKPEFLSTDALDSMSSQSGEDPSIGIPFSKLTKEQKVYVAASIKLLVVEREAPGDGYSNKESDPKIIAKAHEILKDYLSSDEKVIWCAKTGHSSYNLIIKKDKKVSLLNMHHEKLGDIYSEAEMLSMRIISEGVSSILDGDYTESIDSISYDPNTQVTVRAILKLHNIAPGNLARNIQLIIFMMFSGKQKLVEKALILKTNQNSAITLREKEMLNHIRSNRELHALRVSAPCVYGIKNAKICMEYLAFPTFEQMYKSNSLDPSHMASLRERIEKATVIIERNTKTFLSFMSIEPESIKNQELKEKVRILSDQLAIMEEYIKVGRKKAESALRSAERDLEDLEKTSKREHEMMKTLDAELLEQSQKDYHSRKNDLEAQIRYFNSLIQRYDAQKSVLVAQIAIAKKFIHAANVQIRNNAPGESQNASDYFDAMAPLLPNIPSFGPEHVKALDFLKDQGHFDTPISDSRYANWLYDARNDILYKIDENTLAKGTSFTHMSKMYDYDNTLPFHERNARLYASFPAHSKEVLHLSLYLSNIDAAVSLHMMHNIIQSERRFARALEDLKLLAGLSSHWLVLQPEFVSLRKRLNEMKIDKAA